ncbi:hypothetical protein NDU88_006282 [Pleurodeles waltl]|uniref:Uncharacterized protein n=1 Tax=Pleurodeles waltl TaxID=8319 RepID=A0AAV7SP20_PLEWA|nr:hypothetical protein NDU88_006282 [Pleurodeles waltl]
MCAPQFLRPEERWKAAGAALWCRAVLEFTGHGEERRAFSFGGIAAAATPVRPEVVNLTPGQVRAVMEASTLQLADSSGEGRGLVDNSTAALSQANGGIKEGAGLEKTLPPTQSGKEQ